MRSKDALAWIRLIDPDTDTNSEAVRMLSQDWDPVSLKNISTGVLSLGKSLGRMDRAMKLVADLELRLKILRDDIGVSRKAPSDMLQRVCCLRFESGQWVSKGKWIPDILDRAAAFDPVHASSREDIVVDVKMLEAARLDQVICLGPLSPEPPKFTDPKIHHVCQLSNWMSSAPGIFDTIFEAASLIHDRPDLFSPQPDRSGTQPS